MTCTEYDAERLRQELARDVRVSELGIEVRIEGSRAILRGNVTTDERKHAVTLVAERVLNQCTVVNEITVTELTGPGWERL